MPSVPSSCEESSTVVMIPISACDGCGTAPSYDQPASGYLLITGRKVEALCQGCSRNAKKVMGAVNRCRPVPKPIEVPEA